MVSTQRIRVDTKGNTDILDITDRVDAAVKKSGIKSGIANIFVVGSTAALTTMEFEPGLVADLQTLFERIIPSNAPYKHNLRWGDMNGHAHIRASILGPSIAIPVIAAELAIGTWQQIVLIDFDIRPRTREVIVQIVGE